MPQKIVETQSYPKARKCDVPVSNYTTFGDESPSGSDSSLEDLFTNSQSSKLKQCDGRETVNDKRIHSLSILADNDGICNQGNEDRDLDLAPLQMYGEYYELSHDENKCNDTSQLRKFKSLPNKPLGSNMRLVISSPSIEPNGFSSKSNSYLDSSMVPKSDGFELDLSKPNSNCPTDESEILSDFSDLLSSISSPSKVSNGFSSKSNSYLDSPKVLKSNGFDKANFSCSADESKILGDFSDLLSSIPPPSMVFNGFSSNSYQDSPKVPKSNGFDHEVLKPSSKGSLKCEDSYSNTKSGTMSDFFSSISFGENCSMRNGDDKSPDLDLFINKIPVIPMSKLDPDLSKTNSICPADDSKPNHYKSQSNDVLSDIFFSIDIEKDEPKQSKLNSSSLQSLDSNLFFEDLFLGNEADGLKLNHCESQTNGTASDFFLPLPFNNDSTQRKLNSPISSPDINFCQENYKVPISNRFSSDCKQTNSDPQVHGGLSDFLSLISPLEYRANDTPAALNGIPRSDSQDALLTSLLDFDGGEARRAPTTSMSVPKSTSIKSTMHNQKNGEFSFFSVSPENGFSDMVSKLKKDVDSQKNATDDNSTGISMLDLFKSVNSDSCSSLSEYLSTESEGSLTDKNTAETEHDVWEKMDIDLSSCVKTNDDTPNNVPSDEAVTEDGNDARENDRVELQPVSFMIKAFPETPGLKHQRMKFKQGLFAKSISCKLKKDPVLLQKVARIKSELFEKYFNQPFPDFEDKKRVVKDLIVSQANNCMVTFNGRHVCTPKGLEVVESN